LRDPFTELEPGFEEDAPDDPKQSTDHYAWVDAHRARDLGSERDFNDDDLSGLFEIARPSNSYRFYIGGALAIIILALVYTAWRGGQATSGGSRLAPPAPPEAVKQQPVPTPERVVPVPTAAAPKAAAQPRSTASTPEPPRRDAVTRPAADKTAPPPTDDARGAETKTSQVPAKSARGSEELANARRYLDGNGQRNTALGVDWLWRAVAKRNAEATLLLSELFLKGDGVPKNCDQGRVLLDAAASRGSKEAAERLRHLQAFGCQ
jgi:hypothetical protein